MFKFSWPDGDGRLGRLKRLTAPMGSIFGLTGVLFSQGNTPVYSWAVSVGFLKPYLL